MKVIILLIIIANVASAELHPNFVKAIHKVETGGRLGAIKGDNGKALGPFQIHKSYWQDSGVKGNYSDCANYDYALRVVTSYLTRYAPKAVKTNDFETLARVHNGGPKGYKIRATAKYWARVKKQLTVKQT